MICEKTRFWLNFVLHVHCFHYIDCLRIVRSWVILNMLQWKVRIWTMETPARGFMDYKHLLLFKIKCSQKYRVKLLDCNKKNLIFRLSYIPPFPFLKKKKIKGRYRVSEIVLKSGILPFIPFSRNDFWLST